MPIRRLVSGCALAGALALPAAAPGAVRELEGPVENDPNGTVSIEVVVKDGTPTKVRNLAYRNLDAYCKQEAEGPEEFVGEISGNAGANQNPPGVDGRLVHWISYPENPSRQVTMSGRVNSRGTKVEARVGIFNNESCANAEGNFTATRRDGDRGGGGGDEEPRGAKLKRAIPKLEGEARDLSAKTFGGVWVDRRRRGLDVNVAFTRRAGRKVEELAEDFPKPRLLDAVEVEHSLRVLEDEQAELIADRESFRGRTSPFPGVPGGQWDLDIDLRRNTLVVLVEDASPETVAAIKTRYGYDVIVKEGVTEPYELYPCATRFLCYGLRSGLETAATAGSVGQAKGGCSTAFSSHFGRTTKGTMGILSAAHCGLQDSDVTAPRYHAENHAAQYGVVNREAQYGRVDAEWHYVTREPFRSLRPDPLIYVDDSERGGKVKDVGKYDDLVVGYSKVCKSGIITGKTCGVVTTKSASPSYVTWSSDFVRAKLCSAHGDSGAGVYAKIPGLKPPPGTPNNYEAVGILSGGPKSLTCDHPDFRTVFGHIEFAQRELRVKVVRAAG